MGLRINGARAAAIGATLLAGGCGAPGGTDDAARNAAIEVIVADTIDVRDGAGVYVNGDEGRRTEIAFPLPADRVNPTYFHDVERIGTHDGLVAVLDTYGSHATAARCADGRESWLRIFALSARRQIASVPVESCLDRLQAGTPPVTWRGDGFDIGGSRPRRFTITGGTIRALGREAP